MNRPDSNLVIFKTATVATFATVQTEGTRQVERSREMRQIESDFDRAVKQLSQKTERGTAE